jgi:hypothetical protein
VDVSAIICMNVVAEDKVEAVVDFCGLVATSVANIGVWRSWGDRGRVES